jgi:ribonuclease HI
MIVHIDGGSRGNPGPAGYGVRVSQPDGTVVAEFCEAIGVATNNVAEYRGLLAALRYARGQGYTDLTVRSDSLLLVCQMRGDYRVKNPGLQVLHAEAKRLASELGRVRFVHVRREDNTHADLLANKAMDDQEKTEDRRLKTEAGRETQEASE